LIVDHDAQTSEKNVEKEPILTGTLPPIKISPSGQLTVPQNYRDFLGEGYYIGLPWSEEKCLVLRRVDDVVSIVKLIEDEGDDASEITVNLRYIKHDKQGRIVVPFEFREYLPAGGELIVQGAGTFAKLWDPVEFAATTKVLASPQSRASTGKKISALKKRLNGSNV